MKTTLDIADPLFAEAKRIATRDGETLRSLVEQGLRKVLAERARRPRPFRLRDCSVGNPGDVSRYDALSWEEKRELMYGDRGA
jgi:hypothetical protein